MSNGHLAWKQLHESERLTICQNTLIAVLMVTDAHSHTHMHTVTHAVTHTHTHTRSLLGCSLDVQSKIMDVVLSNDALYDIQLCGSINPLHYHFCLFFLNWHVLHLHFFVLFFSYMKAALNIPPQHFS